MSNKMKSFFSSDKSSEPIKKETPSQKAFQRVNYYLMGGCVALIIIGFLLMSGGASSADGGFNADIFSTRRIVVGPTLSFLGFLLMAFAIIYRPKSKNGNTDNGVD